MAEPHLSEPPAGDLGSWNRPRGPVVPRWVGVLVLVVVLLGVSAYVIVNALSSSSPPKRPSSSSSTANYRKFKDPAGVFEGAYPPTWRSVPTVNRTFVLLAEGPNGASYEVAKTMLTAPVNATNLGAAEKLTNRVVKSGYHVKLLRAPEQVLLGGLPGLLYLYTFTDPATGEEGAHAHYFLFDGKEMITLVFQSLPSSNFLSQASLFTKIASTFHVLSSLG
jgi:hypothetical protein